MEAMIRQENVRLPERGTVSVDEAARYLGISRGLAFELVHRGDLEHIRLGRRIRVSISYLRHLTGGAGPAKQEAM